MSANIQIQKTGANGTAYAKVSAASDLDRKAFRKYELPLCYSPTKKCDSKPHIALPSRLASMTSCARL